jgi:hypothetical protein
LIRAIRKIRIQKAFSCLPWRPPRHAVPQARVWLQRERKAPASAFVPTVRVGFCSGLIHGSELCQLRVINANVIASAFQRSNLLVHTPKDCFGKKRLAMTSKTNPKRV